MKRSRLEVLVVAVTALAACSSRAPVASPAHAPNADHAQAGAATPAGAATGAAAHGAGAHGTHGGHTQPTQTAAKAGQANPADVRFMSMMIGHHAQAIVMARMAPTHGASASLQTLSARIINSQQDEITIMQRWLSDHGQLAPDAAVALKAAMSGDHAGHMAGMLTEAQLKELDAARGEAFDRLFLTFMIAHHKGAVTMVDELFASYGAAQDRTVFRLASDINAEQTTEIARMQRMLFDLIVGKQP